MDIQLINNQGRRYSYSMLTKTLAVSNDVPSFNRIVYSKRPGVKAATVLKLVNVLYYFDKRILC